MNKIVIDIGSHKLEEINFFFIKNFELVRVYFIWWLRFLVFLIKKRIFFWKEHKYFHNTYKKNPLELSFLDHKRIFFYFLNKKKFKDLKIVVIEPNIRVVVKNLKKFKKKLNLLFFPFAINNNLAAKGIFFSNFYISKDSLSNSIYKRKKSEKIEKVLSINMSTMINILKDELKLNENSEILLRMNCEGVEYDIIKDLNKNNLKIKFVLGSLYDVMKIHGEREYRNLCNYLEENNIIYKYFKFSDPSTWTQSSEILEKFLSNE